jgi:hypothetical protein
MINNSDSGIISFQMIHIEKTWTTEEIFIATNCENNINIKNSGQYHATILIMKKCENVINIFDNVMNIIESDIYLISDKYNSLQSNYFKDNRHDQSILSTIRKKYNTIIVPEETCFGDYNNEYAQTIPIWQTRYR